MLLKINNEDLLTKEVVGIWQPFLKLALSQNHGQMYSCRLLYKYKYTAAAVPQWVRAFAPHTIKQYIMHNGMGRRLQSIDVPVGNKKI